MKRVEKEQMLVDHYLDFFSVAMAILQDEEEARDVVQEAVTQTLVRLYVNDVCGYCARVTRNMSIKTLERKRRRVNLDDVLLVTDYEHERLLRLVAEKKEELSEVAKAVVELHDEEGYTLSEVAGMMRMSVSTVKRLLSGAHFELKKKLQEEI